MPKYWVDVSVTTRGRLTIEADNLEQAQEEAEALTQVAIYDLEDVDQEDVEVGYVREAVYRPRKKGIKVVA